MARRSQTPPSDTLAPRNSDAEDTWHHYVSSDLAQTIQRDPGATIANPVEYVVDPTAFLDQLAGRDAYAQLDIERTLGQGGMGVVRLARQISLARDVAVKSLRPEIEGPETVRALLREAWVTGLLEHPNVIPVHDLGLDEHGSPFIVFKRIEGVAWNELIRDAQAVADKFGVDDLLEWNLGVLLQVINAVRYAHSHGVLHRDLKPENVMIGEFGEVYVVDWGLAVSTRDDGSGRLPLARDAHEMAGTPLYMAPEMLGAEADSLSERTDIYLLGAVLYEIVTGDPPHRGESAGAVLASVMRSQPEYPDHAPPGLVRICRRALHLRPEHRYERADEVRIELQAYLRHRGSARLAERAERRLADLRGMLVDPRGDDPAWRHDVYNVFGACRFGFKEALHTWPDNLPAVTGLRAAISAMAEHELASGDPRAAANVLAELDDPPAALHERIDVALRDERQRLARLEKLDAQFDPATGARTRSIVIVALGLLLTSVPLAMWLVDRQMAMVRYEVGIIATIAILVGMIALFTWARGAMFQTAVNRRLFGSTAFVPVAQLALLTGCWQLGIPPDAAFVMLMFLWSVGATFVSVLILPVAWPAAVAFSCAFLVSAWLPHLGLVIAAAANFALVPSAWINWRRFRHLYVDAGKGE